MILVRGVRRSSLVALSLITLVGCSTVTTVNPGGTSYSAEAKNCKVMFYKKDMPPPPPFETLKRIETHLQKNLFFGGTVQLERDAYPELRRTACSLGGNAVIIDGDIESSAAEITQAHVWARVLKMPN